MNYSIPSVYNKIAGNTTTGSVVQQVSTPVISEKKDSFEKSNHKTLAITSAGTVGGGVVGAIYGKITEAGRSIPRAILDKYNLDFSMYTDATFKIQDQVWKDEFKPLLESMVDKLSNNKELTPEELKLAKDIDLDPNMVRFFDNAKERLSILKDALDENPDDVRKFLGSYSVLSVHADKFTFISGINFSKRLSSIEENGLKYLDNEEFLDYASSEFFKDITFKIKYDKNGVADDIIPSVNFKKALSEGETLSDATYSFKELVEKVVVKKEFKGNSNVDIHKLSYLTGGIGLKLPNNETLSAHKLRSSFFGLCDIAIDKAKATNEELKNNAIKAYKNKQILKYAGIGALAAGAIALCGTLINKKAKEKEQ